MAVILIGYNVRGVWRELEERKRRAIHSGLSLYTLLTTVQQVLTYK